MTDAQDNDAEGPGLDENKLIAERRAKLAALREHGPAFPNDFRRDALAGQLHDSFGERRGGRMAANPTRVKVGGRLSIMPVTAKSTLGNSADRTRAVRS